MGSILSVITSYTAIVDEFESNWLDVELAYAQSASRGNDRVKRSSQTADLCCKHLNRLQ